MNVNGQIDGLVRHLHLRIIGEVDPQPPGDLLGAVLVIFELGLHLGVQTSYWWRACLAGCGGHGATPAHGPGWLDTAGWATSRHATGHRSDTADGSVPVPETTRCG